MQQAFRKKTDKTETNRQTDRQTIIFQAFWISDLEGMNCLGVL